MLKSFYSLLTEQGHLYFVEPFCSSTCFVFQREIGGLQPSLYRSIVLKVLATKRTTYPCVLLDNKPKTTLWSLDKIELVFLFCPKTRKCWLLESHMIPWNKTSLGLTPKYNEFLLVPSISTSVESLLATSSEEDDSDLLKLL
jgi:hypothetical protein